MIYHDIELPLAMIWNTDILNEQEEAAILGSNIE